MASDICSPSVQIVHLPEFVTLCHLHCVCAAYLCWLSHATPLSYHMHDVKLEWSFQTPVEHGLLKSCVAVACIESGVVDSYIQTLWR